MDDYKILIEQEHSTVMAHYEPLPREDNGYQSEAALEASFIKQLVEQGYEYVNVTTEPQLIANLEQQLAQRERQYEYYRNKLLTFE